VATKSLTRDWSWRCKVNGRVTASAHGYNRRSDAVRAAVDHGMSFINLIGAVTYEQPLRRRIKAAVVVVE
jgi:hypothetical protein